MCQGVKDGEKQGTSKAGRQEVARQAERKPKGSEFLEGGGRCLRNKAEFSASERECNCFDADSSTFTSQVNSGSLHSECPGICAWLCMLHQVYGLWLFWKAHRIRSLLWQHLAM